MKTQIFFQKVIAVLFTAGVIVLTVGCSSSKRTSGNSGKGINLHYSFPEKQELEYQTNSDFKQILSPKGKEFIIDIDQYLVFSTALISKSNTENKLHIDIDTMGVSVTGPQGEISPDLTAVQGKGFDMTLSGQGSKVDVSGAETIEYEITPGEKRNVAMSFKFLFPKLPEKSVKIGDTWSMTDTISEKYDNNEVNMIVRNDYTYVGTETINGYQCARIESVVTGTRTGKAIQKGIEILSDGAMQGNGTYYFAKKEGRLVKDVTSVNVDATLVVKGPQVNSIPVKFEINSLTELRK